MMFHHHTNIHQKTWFVNSLCETVQIVSNRGFKLVEGADDLTIDGISYTGQTKIDQMTGGTFVVTVVSTVDNSDADFTLKWSCAEFIIQNNFEFDSFEIFYAKWKVSFDLYPTGYVTESWSNIMKVGNDNEYGSSNPAVWFDTNSTKLLVNTAVNGNFSYLYKGDLIPLNEWTSVNISQRYSAEGYVFQIEINGTVRHSIINTGAKDLEDVQVHASFDKNHAKARIRNLVVETYPPGDLSKVFK